MRVAYMDDPAIGITVNVIKRWNRGDIPEPIMTTSSGLNQAYARNWIWQVFEAAPSAAAVILVRGEFKRSVPFLLVIGPGGRIFDMARREVICD